MVSKLGGSFPSPPSDMPQSQNFYGVDLTSLREKALDEYFAQPVVGYIHSGCLLSRQFVRHRVNFSTCGTTELQSFDVPFSFVAERTGKAKGDLVVLVGLDTITKYVHNPFLPRSISPIYRTTMPCRCL